MDHLLEGRIQAGSSKAFSSEINYAGPIWVRAQNRRRRESHKAYIYLSACIMTKSCSFVLDLSSGVFIAAFRHFVVCQEY